MSPLAATAKGTGNNSSDCQEGARYRNIVASYLHGSLLPKNPALADFLIRTAVERKYGSFSPGTRTTPTPSSPASTPPALKRDKSASCRGKWPYAQLQPEHNEPADSPYLTMRASTIFGAPGSVCSVPSKVNPLRTEGVRMPCGQILADHAAK